MPSKFLGCEEIYLGIAQADIQIYRRDDVPGHD
jgi:hypothetical protein